MDKLTQECLKEVSAHKFNPDVKTKLYDLRDCRIYKLNKKILSDSIDSLTKDDKLFITQKINTGTYSFGQTCISTLGWAFDFSDVIKRFVVKTDAGYQIICGVDAESTVRYCTDCLDTNVEAIEQISI